MPHTDMDSFSLSEATMAVSILNPLVITALMATLANGKCVVQKAMPVAGLSSNAAPVMEQGMGNGLPARVRKASKVFSILDLLCAMEIFLPGRVNENRYK